MFRILGLLGFPVLYFPQLDKTLTNIHIISFFKPGSLANILELIWEQILTLTSAGLAISPISLQSQIGKVREFLELLPLQACSFYCQCGNQSRTNLNFGEHCNYVPHLQISALAQIIDYIYAFYIGLILVKCPVFLYILPYIHTYCMIPCLFICILSCDTYTNCLKILFTTELIHHFYCAEICTK